MTSTLSRRQWIQLSSSVLAGVAFPFQKVIGMPAGGVYTPVPSDPRTFIDLTWEDLDPSRYPSPQPMTCCRALGCVLFVRHGGNVAQMQAFGGVSGWEKNHPILAGRSMVEANLLQSLRNFAGRAHEPGWLNVSLGQSRTRWTRVQHVEWLPPHSPRLRPSPAVAPIHESSVA